MESPDKQENDKYEGLIERTKPHRFQPGQSGNPAGRPPKDYSITSQVKLLIDKDPKIAREIAHQWLKDATKGKTEARRDLQDRIEGKVTEEHNINLETTVRFIIGKGYEK